MLSKFCTEMAYSVHILSQIYLHLHIWWVCRDFKIFDAWHWSWC